MKAVLETVHLSLVDHVPKFQDPMARSLDANESPSSIYVIDYGTFNEMDSRFIQAIFRKRHILVTDVPYDEECFDADGLSKVGSLSRVLDMQGETMPSMSLTDPIRLTLQLAHSGTPRTPGR
jgi:hypothetical protein